jgi:hypothetical protein
MIGLRDKTDKGFTITFDTESERDQIMTVLDALGIFSQRNAKYDDGWRAYGKYGACFFMKDRANRVWKMLKKSGVFNEEDALDLINLCCFAIRSQRENNFGGEFWEPSDVLPNLDNDHDIEQAEQHVCAVCGSFSDPCEHSNHSGRLPLSVYRRA